jgi:Predicted Fe-S-cluster oxidoreductase
MGLVINKPSPEILRDVLFHTSDEPKRREATKIYGRDTVAFGDLIGFASTNGFVWPAIEQLRRPLRTGDFFAMNDERQQLLHVSDVSDIFVCARCGYCCHGATTVSLDQRDQDRMIAALGMSRQEVAEQYWRITGSVVQMQTRDGHCIFYHPKEGCTVHASRPWRCMQWPFHPSMLADETNFRTITESCRGFAQGLEYAEFCRVVRALPAQNDTGECAA